MLDIADLSEGDNFVYKNNMYVLERHRPPYALAQRYYDLHSVKIPYGTMVNKDVSSLAPGQESKIAKIANVISEDISFNNGLLEEAKCPGCGKDGAYVGFNTVECPNSNCTHYKPISGTSSRIPLSKCYKEDDGLYAYSSPEDRAENRGATVVYVDRDHLDEFLTETPNAFDHQKVIDAQPDKNGLYYLPELYRADVWKGFEED